MTAGELPSAGRMAVAHATRVLDRHPDFRVLRRLDLPTDLSGTPGDALIEGCAIDVETNGLDPETERVIELALRRFSLDGLGRVVRIGRPRRWLEDPGAPIPEWITSLTGITDRDVHGRAIAEGEATCILRDVDFVAAHNARFDRAFVERRLPLARGLRWACSLNDVDWRDLGFEGRSLHHLLMQTGWFYDAHRASTDVDALIRLLDHPLSGEETVGRRMIRRAGSVSYELTADGAPFESRAALRSRGWRWSAKAKAWRREVAADDLDEEIGWAVANAYAGRGRPRYRSLDWHQRYVEE